MMNQSVKLAIHQTQPTSKAAQLRQVMPDIEGKLAAGVQLSVIHQALVSVGFDLSFQTLKTYLYRHRKNRETLKPAPTDFSGPIQPARLDGFPPEREFADKSSHEYSSRDPLSMQEIDRLMKPDPAHQAEKIARYERLARQQQKGRK